MLLHPLSAYRPFYPSVLREHRPCTEMCICFLVGRSERPRKVETPDREPNSQVPTFLLSFGGTGRGPSPSVRRAMAGLHDSAPYRSTLVLIPVLSEVVYHGPILSAAYQENSTLCHTALLPCSSSKCIGSGSRSEIDPFFRHSRMRGLSPRARTGSQLSLQSLHPSPQLVI